MRTCRQPVDKQTRRAEMSATDKPFRVIATGLRGGRANIAFDQALIEARRRRKDSRHDPLPALSPLGPYRHPSISQSRAQARLLQGARHRNRAADYRRRRALFRRRSNRLGTGLRSRDLGRPGPCRGDPAHLRGGCARSPETRRAGATIGRATISKSTAARSAAPAASSTAISFSTRALC